jgi:hypothetical protein
MASSGRVALTFKQAPNGNLCHIVEFSSSRKFLQWFEDPSAEGNYPDAHHVRDCYYDFFDLAVKSKIASFH